jgi:hypothetical protein
MTEEEENPFAPDADADAEVEVRENDHAHLDDETRTAIIAFAQRHLKKHGSDDWSPVYKEFSEIPHRTVRRWIDKVRHGEVTTQEVLVSSIAVAKREAKKLGLPSAADHVPAAPVPAVIAAKGADAHRAIDFMQHLQSMLADLEMLREWSMTEKDGKRTIKNAMYFTQAVKLKVQVLETALRAMQEIWDLGKMQDLYDAVIEEVGKASPEVQEKIMGRLVALNDRRGLTIAARPGR